MDFLTTTDDGTRYLREHWKSGEAGGGICENVPLLLPQLCLPLSFLNKKTRFVINISHCQNGHFIGIWQDSKEIICVKKRSPMLSICKDSTAISYSAIIITLPSKMLLFKLFQVGVSK